MADHLSLKPRAVCLGLFVCWLSLVGGAPVRAQSASQLYSQGLDAYSQGNVPLAKQKMSQSLQVDKNFRPATIFLGRLEAEQQQKTAPAPGLSAKTLQSTMVPVEFKDTTLNSALEFIRQQAAEQSGGKLLINFVVNLPPELANKRITLSLAHVPISEALRYIGGLAGVNFETQKYAIVVTPAAPTAPAAPAASP